MNTTEDYGNSLMSIRYKLVLVGDICVGKTAIMNRFIKNEYNDTYDVYNLYNIKIIQATIGVDFSTKQIDYQENSIKLQIWDSAGQERYKALIPSYVRGAAMIFIVYDISDRNSFKNITVWISFIKSVNKDSSILVLVGNKTDLKREISQNEAKELAKKENMIFFEVSAKNGDNIENMFYSCIIELPFFSHLDIENKPKFVQELIKLNKNRNSSNLLEDVGQYDAKSNLGLKQQYGSNKKNFEEKIIEEKKRKCFC